MRYLITFLATVLLAFNSFAADLSVYAGAGLIKPMEELRKNFEQEHHISVSVHYGGSGELFGLMAAGRPSDVFIPGAAKYTQDALKNGWIVRESIRDLVRHVPVIVVPAGNPAHIQTLEDLTKPGIRVALGDPKGPAIGRVSKKLLSEAGLYEKVRANTRVLTPTVNQLLIYVTLKQADAAIIWEDLVSWSENRGKADVIRIPEAQNQIKTIPTAVTTHGKENPLAPRFSDHIASEAGLAIWKKWGFQPCAR
ncbi:molybdenum ABC transporter substrate-binding pro tein [Desulfonema ishimotonii]|uniref:Molybdenum ABC transporter substrate-binding pro tein n=1 Tax=Desulfonema ishimotonii TaxID=45657 RepID=A0A401FR42_9BACT|nr:molybdate ABC transporter substrate-binding protein [Desulfonema ishimotonii]GBC59425.1 molybdenum ABC transporter substrate-binding pro tein [Desulfonema ishimotonii]